MRKLSTFVDCLLITAVAVAAPTANEDFVVAEDAKTYTNAVNAANAYTDGKIAEIPAPDFSTNNTELVETIEAKAPAPGNYAVVSNAAIYAAITNALQDAALSNKLDKSGGTMTGGLTVPNLTVGSREAGSAVGVNSVAEGSKNTASGSSSHAEGGYTTANGSSSHAEGGFTTANGYASHAEGVSTTANGYASHAEGGSTTAQNVAEHAQGRFNASHKSSGTFGDAGNTLSSIGFGTADGTRKNAVETMQDGKTFIYGLGGYDGTNPTNGVKDLVAAIESKADAADIPEWAKAPTKPTYTASEVGAYSTNETMYVDWIGDIGCIYGDYIPSGVWDFGDGCLRLANWYQFNVHMTAGRQADGIEIFDTSDPTIKTVIPINGSDVATIADIPASVSNIVTAAYINDRVNVTPLAGRTYNFATNIGLYTAVRDIIQALGGSVTNFPAIPQK